MSVVAVMAVVAVAALVNLPMHAHTNNTIVSASRQTEVGGASGGAASPVLPQLPISNCQSRSHLRNTQAGSVCEQACMCVCVCVCVCACVRAYVSGGSWIREAV